MAREERRSKRARKSPVYLNDYYVNATMMHIPKRNLEDITTRKWLESEVKVPRGFKDAIKSPQAKDCLDGMERDIQAMHNRGVLVHCLPLK